MIEEIYTEEYHKIMSRLLSKQAKIEIVDALISKAENETISVSSIGKYLKSPTEIEKEKGEDMLEYLTIDSNVLYLVSVKSRVGITASKKLGNPKNFFSLWYLPLITLAFDSQRTLKSLIIFPFQLMTLSLEILLLGPSLETVLVNALYNIINEWGYAISFVFDSIKIVLLPPSIDSYNLFFKSELFERSSLLDTINAIIAKQKQKTDMIVWLGETL